MTSSDFGNSSQTAKPARSIALKPSSSRSMMSAPLAMSTLTTRACGDHQSAIRRNQAQSASSHLDHKSMVLLARKVKRRRAVSGTRVDLGPPLKQRRARAHLAVPCRVVQRCPAGRVATVDDQRIRKQNRLDRIHVPNARRSAQVGAEHLHRYTGKACQVHRRGLGRRRCIEIHLVTRRSSEAGHRVQNVPAEASIQLS